MAIWRSTAILPSAKIATAFGESQPKRVSKECGGLAIIMHNTYKWRKRFVRAFQILSIAAWSCGRFAIGRLERRIFKHAAAKGEPSDALVAGLVSLGSVFIKLGQALSTRRDLISMQTATALESLLDSQQPHSFDTTLWLIERELGRSHRDVFESIAQVPCGTATLAQVHLALLHGDGSQVAIKVKHPNISELIETDIWLLRSVALLFGQISFLKQLGWNEAIYRTTRAVEEQVDFRKEAINQQTFARIFRESPLLYVPPLIDDVCTENMLTMEFLAGFRSLRHHSNAPELQSGAVEKLLSGFYVALFRHGAVHCDLHPGNILMDNLGRVALIDFGSCSFLTDGERKAFANLFISIALEDPERATRVILKVARTVPLDLSWADLVDDVEKLLNRWSRLPVKAFSVVSFVVSLFAIQRKHRIEATAGFTEAILALIVFEGSINRYAPDLDFQALAIPFVLDALRTPAAAY